MLQFILFSKNLQVRQLSAAVNKHHFKQTIFFATEIFLKVHRAMALSVVQVFRKHLAEESRQCYMERGRRKDGFMQTAHIVQG